MSLNNQVCFITYLCAFRYFLTKLFKFKHVKKWYLSYPLLALCPIQLWCQKGQNPSVPYVTFYMEMYFKKYREGNVRGKKVVCCLRAMPCRELGAWQLHFCIWPTRKRKLHPRKETWIDNNSYIITGRCCIFFKVPYEVKKIKSDILYIMFIWQLV